ncbi:MAG: hypothetical protein CMJ83_09185 [Planctomycetes bacterium]|nr:hypothetical protein [Planctomycetota bacterium]
MNYSLVEFYLTATPPDIDDYNALDPATASATLQALVESLQLTDSKGAVVFNGAFPVDILPDTHHGRRAVKIPLDGNGRPNAVILEQKVIEALAWYAQTANDLGRYQGTLVVAGAAKRDTYYYRDDVDVWCVDDKGLAWEDALGNLTEWTEARTANGLNVVASIRLSLRFNMPAALSAEANNGR